MKTINYTGSSKLISRIVNLLNRKTPLPLDGDGDPDWGTNGQVLSTDGSGNTAWVNQGGGGSGGHTIEDSSGTAMTQRTDLQFVGVYTEDDSANDRTKVNIVRQMTKAAMQALSSAEQEGFIDTTDEDDDYIPISAEDVKRGVSDVDADLTALENGKVNRSGDTMTGALNIKNVAEALVINRQNNSGWSGWIGFYNQSGLLGRLGVSAEKKPFFQDTTERQLATWDDLLLKYGTPFYMPNTQAQYIRFTFTGLMQYESVHLLIFTRRCAGDLLLECSSTGFSSITRGLLVDNGSGYNLGVSYNPNNGYTVKVQVGEWSSAWGIFVHTNFPNATMTMTRES